MGYLILVGIDQGDNVGSFVGQKRPNSIYLNIWSYQELGGIGGVVSHSGHDELMGLHDKLMGLHGLLDHGCHNPLSNFVVLVAWKK